MPVLGQRVGQLHGESVQEEVVLVPVLFQELDVFGREALAQRDDHEADDILVPAEEIRDGQGGGPGLPREAQGNRVGFFIGANPERVAVRAAAEIAVGHARGEQVVGRAVLLHVVQLRPNLVREDFFVFLGGQIAAPEPPAAADQRHLVEVGVQIFQADAVCHARAEKRHGRRRRGKIDGRRRRRRLRRGGFRFARRGLVQTAAFLAGAHVSQAFKRVLAVEDWLGVLRLAVVRDEAGRQRGAAEEDGNIDAGRLEHFHVFRHDGRGLHQQAAHPEHVGLVFLHGLNHLLDRHLGADVDDLESVVAEDDVHQVFADVVDIARDGGDDHCAAACRGIVLLHVRLDHVHGLLHHLGRFQHKRKLQDALVEQPPDFLHRGNQERVQDVFRLAGLQQRRDDLSEDGNFALDDRVGDGLFRRFRRLRGRGFLDRGLEKVDEVLQRIAARAVVVQQGLGHLDGAVRDLVQRRDGRDVDDARVQPGLQALVQEDRVQDLAACRLEAE